MTEAAPPRLHHQRGCSCPSCDYWRRADVAKGERTKRVWQACEHCHASRYSLLDRETGQYRVDLPSCCTDKDRCHDEMKPGI